MCEYKVFVTKDELKSGYTDGQTVRFLQMLLIITSSIRRSWSYNNYEVSIKIFNAVPVVHDFALKAFFSTDKKYGNMEGIIVTWQNSKVHTIMFLYRLI